MQIIIEVNPTSNILVNSQKLFLKLKKLNELFSNIPFEEKTKRKLISEKIKYKSAWYASIVNPLIEINLIPDYLQTETCTNVLLKKETELYIKSISGFSWLKDLNNIELYENILLDNENKIKSDLFNTSVKSRNLCPKNLIDFLENFNSCNSCNDELSSIFYLFFNWHKLNNFNFENQHQIILWLNYKLYNLFGQVALLLPIEDYLYHHCQKSGRDISILISDIYKFIHQETDKLISEFKIEFQNNIDFKELNSKQKIASMHLFNSSFETNFENLMTKNRNLKSLFQKGFIEFINKFEYEILDSKTISQLKYLYENQYVEMEIENKILIFYLKTNINIEKEWAGLKSNSLNKFPLNFEDQVSKFVNSNIKTTPIKGFDYKETEFEIKKKAFFG